VDDLFIVFRYLALHRSRTDEYNQYNVAFEALDDYVNILPEISHYAERISKTGGLDWDEAEKLTERLLTGFETGLNRHYGTTLSTAISFVQKYLASDDIEKLVSFCTKALEEE
jgi:hypothetical protein